MPVSGIVDAHPGAGGGQKQGAIRRQALRLGGTDDGAAVGMADHGDRYPVADHPVHILAEGHQPWRHVQRIARVGGFRDHVDRVAHLRERATQIRDDGGVPAGGRHESASGDGVGRRILDPGVHPGHEHRDAAGGCEVAVEFDQRRAGRVEGQDLPLDAAGASRRVVDLAEQAAVQRHPTAGVVVGAGLGQDCRGDVDPVGRRSHRPRHSVGVAYLPGIFGDQSVALLRAHFGDLFGDAVLAHGGPARHRSGPDCSGHRGSRSGVLGERVGDVGGGVGIGGAESLEALADSTFPFPGAGRQQRRRYGIVAAGEQDHQRSRARRAASAGENGGFGCMRLIVGRPSVVGPGRFSGPCAAR